MKTTKMMIPLHLQILLLRRRIFASHPTSVSQHPLFRALCNIDEHNTTSTYVLFADEDLMKSTGTDRSSEDDLRVLRKNRRTSMDNSQLSAQSKRPEEPESPKETSDAQKKAARRSSHIPTKEIGRSNSQEAFNQPAPTREFRGPIAVPTAGLRRLSLNPSGSTKETSGASRSSPVNPASDSRNKIARPSSSDAKAQQDKQLLLQQKQRQLAEEEEALLKLQQKAQNAAKIKSIRAAPPARVAVTPSPPASPPRVPPPPQQQQAQAQQAKPRGALVDPAALRRANMQAQAQQQAQQQARSPPPPYEPAEVAPAARPKSSSQGTNSRSSYPPIAPQASSPSVESEPSMEEERYTDTDSYDYQQEQDNRFEDADQDQNQYEQDDHRSGEIVDMAIRVVVRKRPISKRELGQGDRDVMEVGRRGQVWIHEPKTKVDLTKIIETQEFRFDDAFEAHETNEVIYSRTIKHLVNFVFDGGKASCFAYGQTGSGKTFSMMGSRPDAPAEAKINAGLYVLAARDIFNIVQEPEFRRLRVFVSCFEIYGGKLFDLLNERGIVKCLEDAKQQVRCFCLHFTVLVCTSSQAVLLAALIFYLVAPPRDST